MVVLDTCVLVDELVVQEVSGISILSLVELRSGVNATSDPVDRARRQERYDAVVHRCEPIPVDELVLERFGAIDATVRAAGRAPRSRTVDLMIAATAAAHGAAVLTENLDDFAGLGGIVEIRRPSRG